MRISRMLGGALAAATLVAGMGALAPVTVNAAPRAVTRPAAASTSGVTAYLCAIGSDGVPQSGGSSVSGNPFDSAITASSACVGHITDLDKFNVDTEMPFSPGGGSGSGASVGKLNFNPISVTIPVGSFSNKVYSMQTSGTAYKYLFVALRRGGKSGPFLTLKVNHATVRTLAMTYDAKTLGGMVVTFEYAGLQMLLHPQKANGSAGPLEVNGWNALRNVADNDPNSVIP